MADAAVKKGFFSRLVGNIVTSFRLTIASVRLVFAAPKVMVLPLLTLAAVSLLLIIPLNLLVWGLANHTEATLDVLHALYFIPFSLLESGSTNAAYAAFVVNSYVLWSLWLIPVLFSTLLFTTVGMHVATQQIKGEEPSLGGAFRVAWQNRWRILALAAFNATVYVWTRYLVFSVLRMIPFVGRWVMRGLKIVLTAVTYLMLPIVIYERSGARSAFKSAWNQVKKTWSGLLVGTGLSFFAVYTLFEVLLWWVFESWLGTAGSAILSIVIAGFLYALSNAVAAAMRASLYWYATTGEVPPGFKEEHLPEIEERASFTGVPIRELGAATH